MRAAAHGFIKDQLKKSNAFRSLEKPEIVTSGEFLTPFFCSTEKLCNSGGVAEALAKWGENGDLLIDYAIEQTRVNRAFGKTIEIITEQAVELFSRCPGKYSPAISGGQRRDWIFSGPVAYNLGLPHITLYKQTPGHSAYADRVELRQPGGGTEQVEGKLHYSVLHIADLLTKGSSIYRNDPLGGRKVGWVPMLIDRESEICCLLSVVSRLQGGEQLLREIGIAQSALIRINRDFVGQYGQDPESELDFIEDPIRWTQTYLLHHGPSVLLDHLHPEDPKLPRTISFIRKYEDFITEADMRNLFEEKACRLFETGLDELLHGTLREPVAV
jgi:hypothetical protein